MLPAAVVHIATVTVRTDRTEYGSWGRGRARAGTATSLTNSPSVWHMQPLVLAERISPHCYHKNGLQEPDKDCQFLANATWPRTNASSGQEESQAHAAAAGLVLQCAPP